MSKSPFMQLYVSDYLGDTQHLTTEQHGTYLLLLMAMWRADAKLPNEPQKLARIARVSFRRWHIVSPEVLEFFTVEDGFLMNKRLYREHQKALSISEKRRNSGRLGGSSNSLKSNEMDEANAKQMPKHSQKPDTIYVKEEPKGSPKKTGNRLSADWQPSEEDLAYARSQGMAERTIHLESENFRDYWTAKSGSGATKLDWPATWRTWVRNSVSRGPPRGGGDKPRKSAYREHQDACARELDKFINRDAGHDEHSDRPDNVIDLGAADYRSERTSAPRWR